MGAGAEDGAELFLEHEGAGEGDADAAPAEEGVGLGFGELFEWEFVAAGVEGADDDGVWGDATDEFGVDFGLFVLVGHGFVLEEEELGAVEADAFGAAALYHGELVNEFDVGGEGDGAVVGGFGGEVAVGFESFADVVFFDGECLVVGLGLGAWVEN